MTSQQFSELKRLIKQNTTCSGSTPGGGTSTSDATEATLLNILSELRDNDSVVETLVKDTNSVVHIRRTTVNADTGVITTEYIDPQTDVVSIPTFPLVISSEDFELLILDDLVDDVAGDGTGALIAFNEVYKIDTTGVQTLLLTLDNKGVPYVLQGTKKLASEIGVETKTATNQILIDGANWSPDELTTTYGYIVLSVADPLNPPTFTGTNNITVPLFEGEVTSYNVISGTSVFDITNVQIVAQPGDKIKIFFDKIV